MNACAQRTINPEKENDAHCLYLVLLPSHPEYSLSAPGSKRRISLPAPPLGKRPALETGHCSAAACLAVIVSATLAGRSGISFRPAPELLPFHSYRAVVAGENPELLRSNFMNAVLFYPAGLLGCDLLPEGWSRKRRIFVGAGLCVLLSLGIECSQYLFSLGQAEADDVIHNGLGSLLGGAVCEILPRRRKIAL